LAKKPTQKTPARTKGSEKPAVASRAPAVKRPPVKLSGAKRLGAKESGAKQAGAKQAAAKQNVNRGPDRKAVGAKSAAASKSVAIKGVASKVAKPAKPAAEPAPVLAKKAAPAKAKAVAVLVKTPAANGSRPAAKKAVASMAPMRLAVAAAKAPASKPAAAKPATRPAPESAPNPPANGKPRKNPAGLNARELDHFRQLLLEKRREIVGDMSSMEREALSSGGPSNLSTLPVHMADMGTDSYEQEFTLGLVEKERTLLREINSALAKIQAGTYGICEGTGAPIGKPRLEAQPWAKYSIDHARRLERGAMGLRI
jgi:DnaK suppressor protein